MKTTSKFKNPITGKMQQTNTSYKGTRLIKLGFDEKGKVVYQEYFKGDILHLAGSLIDSTTFVSF